jgi:phosphatidate cytidylyltransferase
MAKDPSLRKRLVVIDLMIPTTVIFAMIGGWPFSIFVAAILGIAAWEFWRIFHNNVYSPSLPVLILFPIASVVMRTLWHFNYSDLWLGILILAAMLWHTIAQQKGANQSAIDFTLTVGGAVYFGWLGCYAVSISHLPYGTYWLLTVFPIVSLADTGGYLLGRLIGKHKLMPKVSPKKSWEGYVGGLIMGGLGGWGLTALWHMAVPAILPIHGLILGIVLSLAVPFGDFGESMIKRQFNLKDTSNILPGHGGMMDRIDSSLWAAFIGYYVILLLLK